MDAEARAYLDSALEGLRQEIRAGTTELRQEMTVGIGGLRQEMTVEIGSLRQEIGGLRQEMLVETGGLRQEIGSLRQEMTAEVGGLRREMDGRTESLGRAMRDSAAETRRHFDVVGESIRSDVRAVAEGVAANSEAIERLGRDLREEMDSRFAASHAVVRVALAELRRDIDERG